MDWIAIIVVVIVTNIVFRYIKDLFPRRQRWLVLPVIMILGLGSLMTYFIVFDNEATQDTPDKISDFFGVVEEEQIKEESKCSVFYDTGSKAYLESIYGSSGYCDIEEDGLQYKVICKQGIIPSDLRECEVLEKW